MKTLKPVERKDLIPGRIYYDTPWENKSKMRFIKREDDVLYFKPIDIYDMYLITNGNIEFNYHIGGTFYSY